MDKNNFLLAFYHSLHFSNHVFICVVINLDIFPLIFLIVLVLVYFLSIWTIETTAWCLKKNDKNYHTAILLHLKFVRIKARTLLTITDLNIIDKNGNGRKKLKLAKITT